jgi:hypothetical protein
MADRQQVFVDGLLFVVVAAEREVLLMIVTRRTDIVRYPKRLVA